MSARSLLQVNMSTHQHIPDYSCGGEIDAVRFPTYSTSTLLSGIESFVLPNPQYEKKNSSQESIILKEGCHCFDEHLFSWIGPLFIGKE